MHNNSEIESRVDALLDTTLDVLGVTAIAPDLLCLSFWWEIIQLHYWYSS